MLVPLCERAPLWRSAHGSGAGVSSVGCARKKLIKASGNCAALSSTRLPHRAGLISFHKLRNKQRYNLRTYAKRLGVWNFVTSSGFLKRKEKGQIGTCLGWWRPLKIKIAAYCRRISRSGKWWSGWWLDTQTSWSWWDRRRKLQESMWQGSLQCAEIVDDLVKPADREFGKSNEVCQVQHPRNCIMVQSGLDSGRMCGKNYKEKNDLITALYTGNSLTDEVFVSCFLFMWKCSRGQLEIHNARHLKKPVRGAGSFTQRGNAFTVGERK